MENFNKREEGFERAFSHEEELRFRARSRRNRKLGLWAGGKLGLIGEALDAYAAALVGRAVEGGDDAGLIAEVAASLPDMSAHRVGRRLEEFAAEAAMEVQRGA